MRLGYRGDSIDGAMMAILAITITIMMILRVPTILMICHDHDSYDPHGDDDVYAG